MNAFRSSPRTRGFTLIELMIALAVLAIVTAVALPSYTSYVKKSRARAAAGDLTAMALVLENRFQKRLTYPDYSAGVTVPALPSGRDASLADLAAWSGTQGDFFTYAVRTSTTAGSAPYVITATGKTGMNCTLTVTAGAANAATGSNCGFTKW